MVNPPATCGRLDTGNARNPQQLATPLGIERAWVEGREQPPLTVAFRLPRALNAAPPGVRP